MKNMKNYKIIENRPELTPEQISQGMNFAAVKSSAFGAGKAIIKTASIKGIIIKSVITIAIISTTAIVCYKVSSSESTNNEAVAETKENTLTVNKDTMASKAQEVRFFTGDTSVESIQKGAEKQNSEKKVTPNISNVVKTESHSPSNLHSVHLTDTIQKQEQRNKDYIFSEPFKASPNAKCVLLNMDALDNMGSAVPSPITMNCNACEFGYISASELEKRSQLKLIWLSVRVDGKSKFNLESELKNISLIKGSDNKHLHPIAIGIGAPSGNSGEGKFISDKFRAIDLKIIFNKQVDVYLFFEEAAVGDRIIFDDFVQAQIEE